MTRFFNSLIKGVLLGLYLTIPLVASQSAKADDTEVYFLDGDQIDTGRPQVMLLLELSSAMNGGGRLELIQKALLDLANDPDVYSKVDFGFTTFAKAKTGQYKADASVRYPVVNPAGDPNYLQEVLDLSNATVVPGNTPTIEGMSEVYRYFQATSTRYAGPETHPSAVTAEGKYAFDKEAAGCAGKALIVLAHGQINGREWPNATESVVGSPSSDTEMVAYMNNLEGVDTYAVSPGSSGKNKENLDSWALSGGTDESYVWNDQVDCNAVADDGTPLGLCAILKEILLQVANQGTSFVQAGVTVSQQNRLNHDNHLYFAQFQADDIARWPGNLKKYKIEGGELVDINGNPAVDTDTGLFLETRNQDGRITDSTSFWAPKDAVGNYIADGNQVELGGAVATLDDMLQTDPQEVDGVIYDTFVDYTRNVYFDKNGKMEPVSSATATDFNVTVDPDNEAQEFAFKQLRARTEGYNLRKVTITHDDGTTTELNDVVEPARLMGDPLHSVPKVLQYATDSGTIPVGFVGTNMGYLHAVNLGKSLDDADGGKELWAYIPNDLLKNMEEVLDNVSLLDEESDPPFLDATNHNYGLDGEIFVAHADENGNTIVDNGEKALLIVGMRRGGDKYYVLNVSSPGSPEYLFSINGGDTKLEHLGYTWSPVTVTNINFKGDLKTVAIFGGGYDKKYDDEGEFSQGDSGDDVIIYDIADKTVLWNLQKDADLSEVASQIYSVPGAVRAISLKTDNSVAEHLYVADVGGQVFRFDLYGTDTGLEVKASRIFKGSDNTSSDKRRFYYAPSVAFIPQAQGNSFVAVALGSGYRAHPLNTETQDYFFMIKDRGVLNREKTFNEVTFVPGSDQNTLVDVTDQITRTTDASVKADLTSGDGWYIKMDGVVNTTDVNGNPVTKTYEGEKVIAEARILFGKVVFTSYVPTVDLTKLKCSPVIGSGKLYGVNVTDGSSFFSDSTRTIDLISSGIPPAFQLLYTSGGSADSTAASFIGLVGNEVIQDAFTKALTKGYDGVIRVNWRKKPDDN